MKLNHDTKSPLLLGDKCNEEQTFAAGEAGVGGVRVHQFTQCFLQPQLRCFKSILSTDFLLQVKCIALKNF